MKSININVLEAVSTLVAAGEITISQLNEAIKEKRGLNMPCGASRDEHGHFFSFFVATDKEDRTKAIRSKDGSRIKFNLRPNGLPKKDQKAATPGQVLAGGTEGVPELTPALTAALQQLIAAGLASPPPQEQLNEADFSDVQDEVQTL